MQQAIFGSLLRGMVDRNHIWSINLHYVMVDQTNHINFGELVIFAVNPPWHG